MKTKECPSCGKPMKRNGKTSAGRQRWRCTACGLSSIHNREDHTHALNAFLDWLLSKDRQIDMPGQGRSFRRKIARFWEIWPMPDIVDEVHRVIYVDGIYLARNLVVLIACSDEYVLSWYLARAETSRAWIALLSHIAPPEMVITDGGTGFAKAAKACWPDTVIQRCTYHAFCQVRRYTTSRPKLQAGIELYAIAKDLLAVKSLKQADLWVEHFMQWCEFWADFLAEKSCIEGRLVYTHERLRKARRSLVTLLNTGTLFSYLNPELAIEEPLPATNNRIEGKINAQLRSMLRNHRGMSAMRRVKAVYWWCYMHTEYPKSAKEILETMPTDSDIDLLYQKYGKNPVNREGPAQWGEGLVWEELHHKTPYPNALN